MCKTAIAAVLFAALYVSPVLAQDLCNDARMKQMDAMIAKMSDAAKQKEANAALDKSKAAMKADDTAECMKYMNEIHEIMGL